MNVTVADLMSSTVMMASPHQTIGHVKEVMTKHGVNCMPIVDTNRNPIGIITSTDLLSDLKENTPIRQVSSSKVYTIPQYSDPSLAARMMRNHHLHHLVVTHESAVVGVLSTFDLLELVEDHRFVMKNPPTKSSKTTGKRNKTE